MRRLFFAADVENIHTYKTSITNIYYKTSTVLSVVNIHTH